MLQKADLVVTRGGANTLFELLAMNQTPPDRTARKEASRGDQIENAQYFVDKRLCRAIAGRSIDARNL